MNSINEILGIYFYRKQFNDLVQKLRDKDCLNEENLEKVIEHRKRHRVLGGIYMMIVVFPALYYLLYQTYLFFCDPEIFFYYGTKNALFNYFGVFIILYISAWALVQKKEEEWRFVRLITLGIRGKGRIISFSPIGGGRVFGSTEKLCRYEFYDKNRHKYFVKFRQPTKFSDDVDCKKGDQVNIAYDRKNPKNSIVVSLKMEMFNLRKRELPATTDRGETLDQGTGD